MSDQDSGAPAPSASQLLLVRPVGPAPDHAFDPRNNVNAVKNAGSHVSVERAGLFDLLTDLKKLAPCHKDPHRYHERKDELVSRLFDMATAR